MKLTQKQEGFVLSILEGKSQIDAYKANYNCEKMKDETIYVKACLLMKNDKIRIRLEELRNEIAKESKWTVEKLIEKFEYVASRCTEGLMDSSGANKAYTEIGKLCGFYEEKVKHSGEQELNINFNIPRPPKEGE